MCGDGVSNPAADEECDDGNSDDTDECLTTCQAARCGDGVLRGDGSEVCEDGNNTNGDGCSADCQSTAVCGDGVVEAPEEVDPAESPATTVLADGQTCHYDFSAIE